MSENQRLIYSRLGSFADIIHTIGKWKVIEIRDLHRHLSVKISYKTLKNKLNQLTHDGIVESTFLGSKWKHVYLTEMGITFTPFDKTYIPVAAELTHDLLVGKVVQELSKHSNVSGATMYHQIEDNYINPDAMITVNTMGEVYNIAIEVELTQKSKTRMKSKFSKYGRSQAYDYCFYFTNDYRIFRTYRKFLSDLTEDIRKQFFFTVDENIKYSEMLLSEMSCTFKEKEISLQSIIGEKIVGTYHGTFRDTHLRPMAIS